VVWMSAERKKYLDASGPIRLTSNNDRALDHPFAGIEPPAKPGDCLRGPAQFREILSSCLQRRTNRSHLWKTRPVASSGPAANSASRDSERLLAVGAVNKSDRLVVELVQRPDTPDAILIKWPQQPTVTDPAKLTATVAAIVRVLGTAQIELAARRAAGR
jgi:hypothetical protein